jgi:hypothetical protein
VIRSLFFCSEVVGLRFFFRSLAESLSCQVSWRQGGVTSLDPSVLASLSARYGLEMKPETVPELVQRFQLIFPGEPVALSAVG